MGFFSDLKDDLSQAVNELLPEEEAMGETEGNQVSAESDESTSTYEKAEIDMAEASDMTVGELADIASDMPTGDLDVDLDQLLDQVEEAAAPVEEPVYSAPASDRKVDMSFGKQVSDEISILTSSMIINGNIATEGGLDVRGCIIGNVEALGKLNITGEIRGNSQGAEIYAEGARITGELRSQGSIKIGQNAVILGNIFASSAVIAGAVRGDLDVKGPVILDSSAIVMGDIKSKSVQINNGAVVEGMCSQCYAEVNPTSFFEELKKMK